MKFLLELPLVVSLAVWVWSEDPDVTPEFCLESLPLMNTSCWSRLVAKGIGIIIILASCLNKAPIMLNILDTKSTEGLSPSSIYGETLMYINGAMYGYLMGLPFTAYGENVALMVQSIVITILMWQFSGTTTTTTERGLVTVGTILCTIGTCLKLPQDMYYLLMASIMPILIYSRGSQILETYRCKHTGAQSIITTSTNLVGGLIRILTTIKEVGWDMAILRTFFLSCGLNFALFLMYFYYRSNTERFLADLKVKAEKKGS